MSCQQPIIGKATTFTINEIKSNFHPGCFKCGNCSLSMEGKGFFLHEGKYLDQECYHKLVLGKCDACSKAFTDLVVVKVRGKQFHPACFTCNKCSTILSATYIENDSKVYCKVLFTMRSFINLVSYRFAMKPHFYLLVILVNPRYPPKSDQTNSWLLNGRKKSFM